MKGKMFLLLLVLALGLVATPASWATTIDGITFSFSSPDATHLVLEISGTGTGDNGGACGTGGYCGVNNLEAIALNQGTYGTVTLSSTATGSGFLTPTSYTIDGTNIANGGGAGGPGCTNSGFGTCFSLVSGGTFNTSNFDVTITFTGTGTFNASAVDLKGCFSAGSSFCQGSLVSQPITGTPSTPTPEPASLMLLGAGLLGISVWRRRSA